MNKIEQKPERYKRESGYIIIEVAVKNSRQLFNERDPAPFRERDLDPQFVTYLVSAVEEFSLRTKMKFRILTSDPLDLKPESTQVISEAICGYFQYEARITKSKLHKHHRNARYFALVGLVALVICLSLAQLVGTIALIPTVANIASVSLVIIGWVAMWHPIEAILYDWWPIYEKRQYFEKMAHMSTEVSGA